MNKQIVRSNCHTIPSMCWNYNDWMGITRSSVIIFLCMWLLIFSDFTIYKWIVMFDFSHNGNNSMKCLFANYHSFKSNIFRNRIFMCVEFHALTNHKTAQLFLIFRHDCVNICECHLYHKMHSHWLFHNSTYWCIQT